MAELGLAVHWLWGPNQGPAYVREKHPGKCPARKEWQDRAAMSAAELRREYRRGRNLGLHTGLVSGARLPVVALDIDGDHGFIFCQQQKIPCSPVRTLTRTGQHWLYRHPGGAQRVPTRCRVNRQLLDVRGERGNLVLPPSRHHTGFVYAPVEPWTPRLLAQLPTFDPAWIPEPPAALPAPRVLALSGDEQQRLNAARRSLAKMWPAIQGQNGSRACFTAALMLLRRYQLSEAAALSLLTTDYNPRCSPPWSPQELQHKVSSAARRLGLRKQP